MQRDIGENINPNQKAFITEQNHRNNDDYGDELSDSDNDANNIGSGNEDSEEEERSNQIFTVKEAIPPTDYDSAYSKLPENVTIKRVRERIRKAYQKLSKSKKQQLRQKQPRTSPQRHKRNKTVALPQLSQQRSVLQSGSYQTRDGRDVIIKEDKYVPKSQWIDLLDQEHCAALISDGFWYIVCAVCNPKEEFARHLEFLKDRIAANYISFTLLEDWKFDKSNKEQFFKRFYDIMAQGVYYSLYWAYPKSRQILDTNFRRNLVTTFSHLLTGNKIYSASIDHWQNLGNNKEVSNDVSNNQKGAEASLADIELNVNTKSRREPVMMRYSPLVERYLLSHNYETINNVRKWKMLLTQRNEVQQDVDKKFKKFKQVAAQAIAKKEQLKKEMKLFYEREAQIQQANIKYVNDYRKAELAYIKEARETQTQAQVADMIATFKKLTYESILEKKQDQ